MGVLAIVSVGATTHEVKKTDDWDVQLFFVGVPAVDV